LESLLDKFILKSNNIYACKIKIHPQIDLQMNFLHPQIKFYTHKSIVTPTNQKGNILH
jgi:hypothetical protein